MMGSAHFECWNGPAGHWHPSERVHSMPIRDKVQVEVASWDLCAGDREGRPWIESRAFPERSPSPSHGLGVGGSKTHPEGWQLS